MHPFGSETIEIVSLCDERTFLQDKGTIGRGDEGRGMILFARLIFVSQRYTVSKVVFALGLVTTESRLYSIIT